VPGKEGRVRLNEAGSVFTYIHRGIDIDVLKDSRRAALCFHEWPNENQREMKRATEMRKERSRE